MEQERKFVSGPEQVQAANALLDWLNEYGALPRRVEKIETEFLADGTSMGLFAAEAPFKVREYISGAYDAQYLFALQYRTAAASSEERFAAMDELNRIAGWAEERTDKPELGPGRRMTGVERRSQAALAARYEDGTEDYQILMAMTYEVRP